MVAFNAIALFTLLPALVLGAAHQPRGHKLDTRGPHRMAAARAVQDGVNAGHRSAKRTVRKRSQCRTRTAAAVPDRTPEASAGDDSATSAPAEEAAPAEENAPAQEDTPAAEEAPAQEEAPATEAPAEEAQPEAAAPAEDESNPATTNNLDAHAPTDDGSAAPGGNEPSVSKAPNNPGAIDSVGGACGSPQADSNSPNGQWWWLNCGLNNDKGASGDTSPWTPPCITLDTVVTTEFHASGDYGPCAAVEDAIKQAANNNGLPAIMVAAIAMQESTCNPDATGKAGEQGLMQLTGSLCDGAPGGNCKDLYYNANTGARYLRENIDQNGGCIPAALGTYNGWSAVNYGDPFSRAEAQKKSDQWGCGAAPNLDYMDQMFNGWFVGKSGYSRVNIDNRAGC